MQQRNTALKKYMSGIELKQKSWDGGCNCATLLSTNFFWSSLNSSLHATAQHCLKKIYVRFGALAEKLKRCMQLRNTAFHKHFLKQYEFLSPCNSATLLLKKYVQFWVLAEKLGMSLQLHNTALNKICAFLFLIPYLLKLFIEVLRNSATAQPYSY